jgi:hypothetical protein
VACATERNYAGQVLTPLVVRGSAGGMREPNWPCSLTASGFFEALMLGRFGLMWLFREWIRIQTCQLVFL